MNAYLIKENGTAEEFQNVLHFSSEIIKCKIGHGTLTVCAGEGEYFALTKPEATAPGDKATE